MKQPKRRFNIAFIVWRTLSKSDRVGLDLLIESIRTKTPFTGKINKSEDEILQLKLFRLKIDCWERPIEDEKIERWIEYHKKKISPIVEFENPKK